MAEVNLSPQPSKSAPMLSPAASITAAVVMAFIPALLYIWGNNGLFGHGEVWGWMDNNRHFLVGIPVLASELACAYALFTWLRHDKSDTAKEFREEWKALPASGQAAFITLLVLFFYLSNYFVGAHTLSTPSSMWTLMNDYKGWFLYAPVIGSALSALFLAYKLGSTKTVAPQTNTAPLPVQPAKKIAPSPEVGLGLQQPDPADHGAGLGLPDLAPASAPAARATVTDASVDADGVVVSVDLNLA